MIASLPYYAVIVAGGRGLRMDTAVAKQFLLLAGKPLLMHTIGAFRTFHDRIRIVLVLHPGLFEEWERLCRSYRFDRPTELIPGGEERFDSVQNGLQAVPGNSLVAVHDGARPLVSPGLIERAYRAAAEKGSAIPVISLQDTIREISGDKVRLVDRSRLFQVQTPQVFRAEELKKAYASALGHSYTDDAAVMEAAGHSLNFIEGERENFKITVEADLVTASKIAAFLSS